MRRMAAFVATLTITTATLGLVTAAPAGATTSCPPNPAPGSTVSGTLVVPPGQYCTLDHVTVTGNATVGDYGSLSLRNSRIRGYLTVGHLASLYMENSTVDGYLSATNGPEYIFIIGENGGLSRIGSNVTIIGATGGLSNGPSIPAVLICGAKIGGNLTVNATQSPETDGDGAAQPQFIGGPGVIIGGEGCSSASDRDEGGQIGTTNAIGGSVNLRNNQAYVSFDDNTVGGSVYVFGNSGGGDLVSNNIASSLRCGSNEPPFYSSGNKVQGTDTCTPPG